MYFVNLADAAGLDDLIRLQNVRHAPLLHAHLHDGLGLPLGFKYFFALRQIVRERLFHIHIFARFAGGDRHRHVPMVRRADDHGIHIFAGQEFGKMLRGEGVGIGECFALLQMLVPHIADRRDADARNFFEAFHQPPAAPAGADAADLQGIVGRIAPRGFQAAHRQDRGPPPAACPKNPRRDCCIALAPVSRSGKLGLQPEYQNEREERNSTITGQRIPKGFIKPRRHGGHGEGDEGSVFHFALHQSIIIINRYSPFGGRDGLLSRFPRGIPGIFGQGRIPLDEGLMQTIRDVLVLRQKVPGFGDIRIQIV